MYSAQQRREYYELNPGKAWFDGYCVKSHYKVVGPEVYPVWRFYLPKPLRRKVKKARRWFRYADAGVPYEHRRRKTHEEFPDLALLMLSRLGLLIGSGVSVRAGSGHVSPVPWAIFGSCTDGSFARHHFRGIDDLYDHYESHGFFDGDYYAQDLCLLESESVLAKLGERHHMTSNLVIALALLLLTDVIINCGPDCVQFFDCFTNDYRDMWGSESVGKWQQMRQTPEIRPPQRKRMVADVEITDVTHEDLCSGAMTHKTFCVKKESDEATLADVAEFYNGYNGWGS